MDQDTPGPGGGGGGQGQDFGGEPNDDDIPF